MTAPIAQIPANAAQLALAAARRPVLNGLVAPLAAGPIRHDQAHSLLATFTAVQQRVEAEHLRSLHPAVYQDASQRTADGVLRSADILDERARSTAEGTAPTLAPGADLTPWAVGIAADGLAAEAQTRTAWWDDQAQVRLHLAFAPDLPQHDRDRVLDALQAVVRPLLH
ncbi:hypothetical protein [Streptacidiphilus sp. EB103A]|uniref:hypothetical protein n=1 Tax=Streptacidiphilus sp. EB103A TaxID=3156275 RepID=UPI00351988F4